MWALSITVTSSVLSTSLVGRESGHTTIGVHLHEVQRAVETTWQVGHVDIESEFLVLQVEHLVVRVILHEVDTGTNVFVRASGNELNRELVAARGDTICTTVICTIEGTVLRGGKRLNTACIRLDTITLT